MSSRSIRLIKTIEAYTKSKPNNFDTSVIFNKVKLISISDNTTRSQFKIDTSMCNGGEILHGGFIAACSDVLSVFTNLGNTGKIAWTMSLHVEFISSARIGDDITVDTSVIRKGNYPVMETKFTKPDGALVAKAIISMLNGNEKYQDGTALRCASFAYKTWKRIIIMNKILKDRLNRFELSIILGSKSIMKFVKTKRKKKKIRSIKSNYAQTNIYEECTTIKKIFKGKRGGDDIVLHTKRLRLF